jgi:Arc/MetJ-type ribon-helix-helix transcriptional regulator
MPAIDFNAPAELFVRATLRRGRPVRYRRFETASEAVRFAVEELPEDESQAAVIEVDEVRYEGTAIRALYETLPAQPSAAIQEKAAKLR